MLETLLKQLSSQATLLDGIPTLLNAFLPSLKFAYNHDHHARSVQSQRSHLSVCFKSLRYHAQQACSKMQNASIPTLNIQQIYSDYPFSSRQLSKLNKYSTKEQSRPIQVSRCEYVSRQFGPIRKCGQSTTICAVCLERLSGMELSSFIEKWFLFTQRSVLELLYPTQRDHLCNLHLDSNSVPVHFDSRSVPNKTQVEYVRIPNQKHISVSY